VRKKEREKEAITTKEDKRVENIKTFMEIFIYLQLNNIHPRAGVVM
jgi:hypothetical protein